ncbi:MAG: hypothetical protein ACRDPY_15285 [Streptosporangiaceae bacterium]
MPWQKTDADRQRDARTYDAAYRGARDECLRRANWRCEIRLTGICIGAATQADHIDQAANDPGHQRLRAACTPCHRAVTATQGGGARNAQVTDPQPQPRTAW